MRRAILMLAFASCAAAPVALARDHDPAAPAATAATAPAATPAPRKLGPFGRAMADFTNMLREAGTQPRHPPATEPVPATATPTTPETLGDDVPVHTAPPPSLPSARQPAPSSEIAQQPPPAQDVQDAQPPREPPPAVLADADPAGP